MYKTKLFYLNINKTLKIKIWVFQNVAATKTNMVNKNNNGILKF